MHVHDYREPDVLRGKRVLVLGIGNSATDIAVESSRIADATFLAMRRGAYVIPKYLSGKPTDEIGSTPLTPAAARRCSASVLLRLLKTRPATSTDYGLPEARPQAARGPPDGLLRAAAADRPRRHHRQAEHRALRRRPTVRFVDGSEEEIDLVIYCTGYKITFPFFDPDLRLGAGQPDAALPPGGPGRAPRPLLHRPVQPLGAIMPIAEAQSEWVADLLEGRGDAALGRPRCEGDRRGRTARWRKRYVAPSGTRSRSTSTPTCARSGASAGGPLRRV